MCSPGNIIVFLALTILSSSQAVGGESGDDDAEVEFTDKGKGKATHEFEDEEQLATVTVVEEFDPEALRHGSTIPNVTNDGPPVREAEGATEGPRSRVQKDLGNRNSLTNRAKNNAIHEKAKSSKKKIPYETKAARKATNLKQRARKLEKASLAASRNGDRRKVEKKSKKSRRG